MSDGCLVCGGLLPSHKAAGRPHKYCGLHWRRRIAKSLSGVRCRGCGKLVEQNRRGCPKHYCNITCKRSYEAGEYLRESGRAGLLNFKHKVSHCARCSVAISVETNPNVLHPKKFCSVKCAAEAHRIYEDKKAASRASRHRRRARKQTAPYETFSDLEIFERDNWICGICKEPIDREVKYPHPKSKSLDHILPLSKGGHHLRKNCQGSHFGCNSKKTHLTCEQVA